MDAEKKNKVNSEIGARLFADVWRDLITRVIPNERLRSLNEIMQ